MTYLYIFEDGSLRWTRTDPSNGDLYAIAAGILQIVAWSDETGIPYDLEEGGSLSKIPSDGVVKCPKCDSPSPILHPAAHADAEIKFCDNPFHAESE
jgi:hypothetical protein